jgi:type I restriction enzyme, S subunit
MKPGYKQTEVGVIPEEWEAMLLDRIAKRGSGHTPDKKRPEYWNGNIKWISLADSPALDRVYIDDTFAKTTAEVIANSSAVLYNAGTVVLTRDAGVGKSAIMRSDMAVSQHFMAWRCSCQLDNHFLYYWLQSAKPEFERIANGSTILTIGLPYFRELKVPYPPLPEQRAIATALGDMDALLASLDRLIAKKRDLKQAAMQQLLTGKTRLPGFKGEWSMKRLGDVGTFLKGSGVKKDESNSGALPCIRYGEIYTRHNDYIKEFHSFISIKVAATACLLKKGDLLFAGSGETKEEIGKCVAFLDDFESYAGGDIVILRPQGVDSLYLGYSLNTSPINRQKASRGQGDAVVHIGSSALAGVSLNLPPLPEQTAIATVLSDMDLELAALEQRRDKTRALKQGMMQELLTGRTRLV